MVGHIYNMNYLLFFFFLSFFFQFFFFFALDVYRQHIRKSLKEQKVQNVYTLYLVTQIHVKKPINNINL